MTPDERKAARFRVETCCQTALLGRKCARCYYLTKALDALEAADAEIERLRKLVAYLDGVSGQPME